MTSNHQSLLQCSEQRPDVMRIPCRLKTAFGHGAPNLEKHRRIFFFIFFFRGDLQEWDMYIYIYGYIHYMYYLQYLSSVVFFFLTTLQLVSPPWSFNCRTPGVSWTASSPAGQRRCSWKRHLVQRHEVSSVQNHGFCELGGTPQTVIDVIVN